MGKDTAPLASLNGSRSLCHKESERVVRLMNVIDYGVLENFKL